MLSNGIVGVGKQVTESTYQQLVGPGHGTIVYDEETSMYKIIFHASIGENCVRYPFIANLAFGADAWPYVNF